ncbi:hypothetical protein LPTSP4_03300 [Leptospira ryugenii]|uniref:Uncharacterized protein n=2 Tax=Leptospira ryugenii TaxID=1917863 RepID=A0A2P2DW87_9LEPT|nr:hypothetical protein LPTSP4_03300 [Leptospira ryugenii]
MVTAWRTLREGFKHPSYELYRSSKLMKDYIPEGSIVSTVNIATAMIYENRRAYYYPLAIDDADFVILPYGNIDSKNPYYPVWVNYDVNENEKMNQMLNNRLKERGYNLSNPKLFPGNFAVFKREMSHAD